MSKLPMLDPSGEGKWSTGNMESILWFVLHDDWLIINCLRWCHLAEGVVASHVVVGDLHPLHMRYHHALWGDLALVLSLLSENWDVVVHENRVLLVLVPLVIILVVGPLSHAGETITSELNSHRLGIWLELRLFTATKREWILVDGRVSWRKVKHVVRHQT